MRRLPLALVALSAVCAALVPGLAFAASHAVAVTTGPSHTCAATTGGGVQCWGDNAYGQLGDGTTADRTAPVHVSGLGSGVSAVVAGYSHTCAVTTAGGVKCWGDNAYGQLGDGTATDRTTPTDVSGLTSGVAAVAAGGLHTCAVTTEGGVKCWGDNSYGELGDGTTTGRATPTDVPGLESGVVAVAVGYAQTCALSTDGSLKCWGYNGSGQLGDGTTTDRTTPTDVTGLTSGVTAVAAGAYHSCALVSGGGVKCWGYNGGGQLGDGTLAIRLAPTDVAGLSSGAAAVTTGAYHTCALTTGGGVKCWGFNFSGQLGEATTSQQVLPTDVLGRKGGSAAVSAGGGHTCAVTTGGGVKCWGDNSDGQLGAHVGDLRLTPVRTLGFGRIDFDSDDVADIAVYRPASGTWFSLDSSTANTSYAQRGWGLQAQGDVPAPGDYDGDGVVDPTVYRTQFGTWFILKSSSSFAEWAFFGWGNETDTLMPGDYDGDGATDAALYRPSTGQWFVLPSSTGFGSGWDPIAFGSAAQGDVPIAGDFDGDGKRDPAVFRAATGTWFWLKSSSNYTQYDFLGWGLQSMGDTPAPGDYDGDGKTDPTVYRAQYGTWFVLTSSSNYTQYTASGWGTATDTLVQADYDADGRTDVAVYRPSTGEWFVRPSSGASPWTIVFGQAGDVPLVVR